MSNSSKERVMKLLAAARQSPDFGVRLLAELPPTARAEMLRRWTVSGPVDVPAAKPGLKKCSSRPAPSAGLGAQLRAFSRTIGRVG